MLDPMSNQDAQLKRSTRRTFLLSGSVVTAGVIFFSLRSASNVEASGAVHGTPGEVALINFSDDGRNLGRQTVAKIVKTDSEWRQQLGANSYDIARRADTEMAFSGVSWKEHGHGVFRCICCETALFSSQTKFESGTGWPSFWAPLAKENIVEKSDTSMGIERTEVQCARCEGHLGHVFSDGPEPTGLRYCMNSASMRFIKA